MPSDGCAHGAGVAPVGGFFQELAKTLAERWLSLLALPGAFFIAAMWIALTLGQSQSWNYALLTRRADEAVTAIADQPAGTQVLLAVALLVTAVGAASPSRRSPG